MDGILVVDKPAGITSFDVIRRLRPVLREKRIGHTGTLDPMATGVLPLCLGEATKIAPFLIENDKEYEAEVTLGEERDTQDATGRVVATGSTAGVDERKVRETLRAFLGDRMQVPPMHSAVKVGGERLYARARRGETVERTPRPIRIHSLEMLAWHPPRFTMRVSCSKGTYVRTLAHDIGQSLGCGAHLSALRRLRSGPFVLPQAVPLDQLVVWATQRREEIERRLVKPSKALAALPEVRLDARCERKARLGQPLTADDLATLGWSKVEAGTRVRLTSPGDQLVAIGVTSERGVRYERVLGTRP